MAIYHPPTIINIYLQQKLGPIFGAVPMFPTVPSDLASVSDGFTIDQLTGDDAGVRFTFGGQAAIYDRMFKMRRTPFPYIKCEQVLYYFYAMTESAVVNLIEMTQNIQDLLDRGDDSAQDINEWVRALHSSQSGAVPQKTTVTDLVTGVAEQKDFVTINGEQFLLPYFHSMKVFQLQETRDIIDFGTARTYAGNKIVVDYDWHKS